jgi:ferredoxin-thioredoxin reductase catalytic chain
MDNAEITEKEIEEQISNWKRFTEIRKKDKFKLNPDFDRVKSLAKGVLHIRKKYGLGFCPCRIQTKDREKDLKLICPCNFKIQKTWQEKGECWCSLFVRA